MPAIYLNNILTNHHSADKLLNARTRCVFKSISIDRITIDDFSIDERGTASHEIVFFHQGIAIGVWMLRERHANRRTWGTLQSGDKSRAFRDRGKEKITTMHARAPAPIRRKICRVMDSGSFCAPRLCVRPMSSSFAVYKIRGWQIREEKTTV